jgi:hypothetical protein
MPARRDRLPWSRFHMLIVIAPGVTWILDGLEVTIVRAIGPVLQETGTWADGSGNWGHRLGLRRGAVCGALIFGWLTDRFGRKFVFYVTLLVYLAGVLLTADVMELLELRDLSGHHRRRDRRRLRRHQLGHR